MVVVPRTHSSVQLCALLLATSLFSSVESLALRRDRPRIATRERRTLRDAVRQTYAEGDSSRRDVVDEPGSNRRLMVFGLGNVGAAVARRSAAHRLVRGDDNDDGDDDVPFFEAVYGTTRGGAKDVAGVRAVRFDSHRELAAVLPSCTHVLVTIPPVETRSDGALEGGTEEEGLCDPVLDQSNFSFRDLVPANAWIGYVSSTSVYGDHDGEWVDEDSEARCQPGSKGALYHRAENEWREAARAHSGWTLHVFRSSGLYGDGRSAIHTIRKRGVGRGALSNPTVDGNAAASERTRSKRSFPTSRIHEEDVSRAISSAMVRKMSVPRGDYIWNLADDNPAPRAEVMEFGTQLLTEANLLPPEKAEGKPSSSKPRQSERAKRRMTERKRVSNQRMKDLLLPNGKLLYPTYCEGLQSVLNSNREEWGHSIRERINEPR